MLRRPLRSGLGSALAFVAFGYAGHGFALSADQARRDAGATIGSVEAQMGSIRQVPAELRRIDPSRLVTAAELHLRTKDYESAIDQLNKVVELERQGKVPAAVAADAAYLLGEAYFAAGQLHSAGRYYELVTDRADRPAYAPFAGRAASRLVDVALRTRRTDALPSILARVNRLAPTDPTGSLQFARAKTLFAQGDLSGARAAAASVPPTSEFGHRAAYLAGVTLVREHGRPASAEPGSTASLAAAAAPSFQLPAGLLAAIQAFRKAAELPAKNAEQQHVVDLSWMAIGRLLYEQGAYLDASEAYNKVQRSSPEFTTALYELGWTYVRLGDYERGQRALELLSVLEPGRSDAADGALLRADLLLRSGRYEQALAAYHQARDEYDPLQRQVAAFLANHTDPADYYDVLTADRIDRTSELPEVALDWAREEAAEDRMFAVTDEVAGSRRLVKRSRRLISQLNAVLGSPSRAKMFPTLQAELEKALGLLNQLSLARRQLALGLDDEAGEVGGELASVRQERRKLMARLGEVPAFPADFNRRQSGTEASFNAVSQEVQKLTLRADYLQAMVNGLRRVLADAARHGAPTSGSARARFEAELAASERELQQHRVRIEALREGVELGRVQIGLGDEHFAEDDAVRRKFRELFGREIALVAAGGDSRDAAEYARSVEPLLRRIDQAEVSLERSRASLESASEGRSKDMAALVDQERALIEQYAGQLEELDQNARVLLGEMAMQNLELVRQRLRNVVQRADVGVVQHAWELREEHMHRVRQLQRERAREERYLNDELREVLDDAEDNL
jgi:tetratricopeptide (TPR) repeat protein